MRPILFLAVSVALLSVPSPVSLAGEDLQSYVEKYHQSLANIEAAHSASVSNAMQNYGNAVDALAKRFQAAGKLDELKAASGESARFKEARALPSSTEDFPKEMQDLCNQYVLHLKEIARHKSTRTLSLAEQYDKALARLQRKLTQSGDIEAAAAVQNERKSRTQAPEIIAAREEMESTRPPAPPIERDKPGEPSGPGLRTSPVNESDWRTFIWSRRAGRWQIRPLSTMDSNFRNGVLTVRNTSRAHRAGKVAYAKALQGDFVIEATIKGEFGLNVHQTTGESGHGFGVYGVSSPRPVDFVIKRKGDELLVTADGKARDVGKGQGTDRRAPMYFCIELGLDKECEISGFSVKKLEDDLPPPGDKGKVTLTKPYPQSYSGAETHRISVQYAVIEIAKQAGIPYNWDASYKNTNPVCRRWVYPSIKNKSFETAMRMILRPVGLTYEMVDGQIVLQKR